LIDLAGPLPPLGVGRIQGIEPVGALLVVPHGHDHAFFHQVEPDIFRPCCACRNFVGDIEMEILIGHIVILVAGGADEPDVVKAKAVRNLIRIIHRVGHDIAGQAVVHHHALRVLQQGFHGGFHGAVAHQHCRAALADAGGLHEHPRQRQHQQHQHRHRRQHLDQREGATLGRWWLVDGGWLEGDEWLMVHGR